MLPHIQGFVTILVFDDFRVGYREFSGSSFEKSCNDFRVGSHTTVLDRILKTWVGSFPFFEKIRADPERQSNFFVR